MKRRLYTSSSHVFMKVLKSSSFLAVTAGMPPPILVYRWSEMFVRLNSRKTKVKIPDSF
jgi:hypothetical protein